MSHLFRPAPSLSRGTDPVVLSAEDAAWDWCGLSVLASGPGEVRTMTLDSVEGAFVPLSGSFTIEYPEGVFRLEGRSGVFDAVTDLCYLPVGSAVRVHSDTGGEIAVATARASELRDPIYVAATDVSVDVRGAGHATRQINGLLPADRPGPQRLIVVEVLTPEGNWSSYPPHKHDEWTKHEVPLEEVYYFRIRGDGGFGLHSTYTLDGEIDEAVRVSDGDVFLVPRGYHGPCVASPGYDMYYLNVMAGPADDRLWMICTDPVHKWLWEAWKNVEPDPRVPMTSAKEMTT